jgi:carboxyl-terminal processing protease
MRRKFLALLGALCCACAWAQAPAKSDSRRNLEDFDAFWKAIDGGYAYFDGPHLAWKRARDAWRRKAGSAKTRGELVLVLEGAIAHLQDDHVSLSESTPASARRIPAETDIWAQWVDGAARVTAVRAFSDADVAGLRPGHVVTHVNGRPVELVVQERLKALGAKGPAAMDWALRHLLAGPREGLLKLKVSGEGEARTMTIEHGRARPPGGPPLLARRMGEERDLAYIRILDSLGDPALPRAFDAALGYLKDARALILDLRETMNDGTRDVTDALIARLTAQDAGPRRLIVLVDRWTAGEGEALAAALQDRARATLIGTPMAGLRGRLREAKLPHSGIVVRFPGENAPLASGAPRETLRPAVEIDLAAPSGGPGDPILYQALKLKN